MMVVMISAGAMTYIVLLGLFLITPSTYAVVNLQTKSITAVCALREHSTSVAYGSLGIFIGDEDTNVREGLLQVHHIVRIVEPVHLGVTDVTNHSLVGYMVDVHGGRRKTVRMIHRVLVWRVEGKKRSDREGFYYFSCFGGSWCDVERVMSNVMKD